MVGSFENEIGVKAELLEASLSLSTEARLIRNVWHVCVS